MSTSSSWVLATRQSPLALAQATFVQARLSERWPQVAITLSAADTTGDRTTRPLRFLGGKGLFLKELESMLLSGEADFAVHSLKDVPSDLDERFCLPVLNWRESPADVCLLSPGYPAQAELDLNGRIVATSSQRRVAQLRQLWPEVRIVEVRGNLGTRLHKLEEHGWDALVLAAAGLHRLGLHSSYRTHLFDPQCFLPAVGQGVLAIEVLKHREDMVACLSLSDHLPTRYCSEAEREVSLRLGADCSSAIGALASYEEGVLSLTAAVFALDGRHMIRASAQSALPGLEAVEYVAHSVSLALIEQGARVLLDEQRTF